MFDQNIYITEDGKRFFVSVDTYEIGLGSTVLVYEPFVSKEPVFQYAVGLSRCDDIRVTFYEKHGEINLMIDQGAEPIHFFHLFAKHDEPFATYDLSEWKSVYFRLVDGRYLVDFDLNEHDSRKKGSFFIVELYTRP